MFRYFLGGIFFSFLMISGLFWIFFNYYTGAFLDDAHQVFFAHESIEEIEERSVSAFVSQEASEKLEILLFLERYDFLLQAKRKKELSDFLRAHGDEIVRVRSFVRAEREAQIDDFFYEFCKGDKKCMPRGKNGGSPQLYESNQRDEPNDNGER